ncbi:IS200/IS605 family transposase [Micromonospora sp. SL4-19]|uniref:IS200/IS605 family transposase n=1 Tax=Micromonospora sp. SL4-19 TaxID=3399129 RepID=UPI003A4D9ED7
MSPRWTPDPNIRRGRSVVHHLHAHLVFTTRYRRGALTDPILTRCQQIMTDVCTDFGAQLREFNGEDDHVHLLVHYPPSVALSKLVNSLKGVSARYLRREFAEHLSHYLCGTHLWSPSYFAGSCDGPPLAAVREYIENQKRHGP